MNNPLPPLFLSKPGLLCCAGDSFEAFFAAAQRGDTRGIVPYNLEVGGKTWPFLVGRAHPPPLGPSRLLSLCAAALQQLQPTVDEALRRFGPRNIGLCLGSCDNGSEASTPAHRAFFQQGAFPPGYALPMQGAARPAEFAARFLGIEGPVLALATACASSASAIIRGAQWVAAGLCEAVVVGGVDVASELALLGFAALEAVSPEVCNPFSKNRKGINLGEGAAFFVLSREKLGEEAGGGGVLFSGFAESADAHHMTAPHPEGAGAAAAMQAALQHAGLCPEEVGYVNLHGTATPLNDAAEAKAMVTVFGQKQPLASSTKPVTGHTLGAAGALELALCWGVVRGGRGGRGGSGDKDSPLPLHCWDGVADETLPPLNFVGPCSCPYPPASPLCAMSNAFAFGGCNTSLILRRGDAP